MPTLSPRFEKALAYAADLHKEQRRKGTDIPYVSHLLGVASIALEHGATEDEAIGALLHDAIEDQPRNGRTREEIREQYGVAVLAIVEGCTDGDEGQDRGPEHWRPRKEKYVAHVASASASTRLVSAADKLHNARAILSDYHTLGEALWGRFNGGKEGTLWYYRALVAAFEPPGVPKLNARLVKELDRVVSEMERLARGA